MPRGTEHIAHQKRAPVSSCALWHRARHPSRKGSGVTTCLEAPCAPLASRGLWCCHVRRGTEPITRQKKASESPRASWLQARPLRREALALPRGRGTRTTVRQDSDIDTCPVALNPPLGAGGLRSHHVPSGSRPPGIPVRSQDV
jgi:hypothetical protein